MSQSFADLELQSHYQTGKDDILGDFYRPVLRRSERYDRLASYFSSVSLAAIGEGLIEFVENGGTIRMVINTQVDAVDLDVLRGERETPTEHLSAILDPARAADDVQRVRWEVLAWLLANEQLELRVAAPETGDGIFHPKVGIFRDGDDEVITSVGSNNETIAALQTNYEYLKVNTSLTDERRHWQGEIRSFEEIWKGERDGLGVYDLPEAIEAKILEVAPPDKQRLMDDAAKHLPEYLSTPTDPTLTPLVTAGRRIGGTHLAEDISPLTPWVHQRIVADTLTAMYPRGFLLCDEVGLGKTIEAGLTVARLIHTGEVDSCLILTPANLMTQWQEELLEKFNLQTHRFERGPQMTAFVDGRGSTVEVPDDVADPIWWFTEQRRTAGLPSVIIASWHLMRRGENQELIIHPDAARDGSMPHRGRASEAGIWDLVIVDEAHKARRTNFNNLTAAATENANKLLQLLRRLRETSRAIYLLTATPMAIHSVELFDLLSVVGLPEAWDDPEAFIAFFEHQAAIQQALADADAGIKGDRIGGWSDAPDMLARLAAILGEDRTTTEYALLQTCAMARAFDRWQQGRVYPEALRTELQFTPQVERLVCDDEAVGQVVTRKMREQSLQSLKPADWQLLADALDVANPVEVLLHRNTRDVLRSYHAEGILGAEETVARRNPRNRTIPLGDAASVYDAIEEYVRRFYQRAGESDDEYVKTTGLVMTVYRQRLTSSFAAIAESLQSRLERLRGAAKVLRRDMEDTDAIDEFVDQPLDADRIATEEDSARVDEYLGINPNNPQQALGFITDETEALEGFIEEVAAIRATEDPKLKQLRVDIREAAAAGRRKVMIFTQYTDTLEMIRAALVANYGRRIGCYSGRGGERYVDGRWREVGKEQVKEAFAAEEDAIDILVCTESASHGLNMQQCGVLINYDLPWNPMRVEQRIGRIDRIGQRYDTIWIYNYFYEDSVEQDVYDALQERVGMFESYVGGMQPIVGKTEDRIREGVMRNKDVELPATAAPDAVRSAVTERAEASARLAGYTAYRHPDLGEVGAVTDRTGYPVNGDAPAIELSTIGALIERAGIALEMRPTAEHGVRLLEPMDDAAARWLDPYLGEAIADTHAEAVRENPAQVAVTTDPSIADRYPSLRYLAPGEPIVDALLVEVAAESTVDDQMLTIDGEPTESLAEAVIVGPEDDDLTGWVEAYRRLRSAVVERSR